MVRSTNSRYLLVLASAVSILGLCASQVIAQEGELPAEWQQKYFNTTGIDPKADADGDGKSNWEEFTNGTDPTDYYNGKLPTLSIVAGKGQRDQPGAILPQPVIVLVDSYGAYNAPLTFSVISGKALLAVRKESGAAPMTSLEVRSVERAPDAKGVPSYVAQAYVVLPASSNDVSTIEITARSGQQTIKISTKASTTDPNLTPPTHFVLLGNSATTIDAQWTPSDLTHSTVVEGSRDGGKNWKTLASFPPGQSWGRVYHLQPDVKWLFRVYTGDKMEPETAPSGQSH